MGIETYMDLMGDLLAGTIDEPEPVGDCQVLLKKDS